MCHHEVTYFGKLKHSLLFLVFFVSDCQNLICVGKGGNLVERSQTCHFMEGESAVAPGRIY